ncbi:MAG: rod shape-determining protein MreD [Chloroflexi bacterium]|nr:rod shape-determining protein MreD [Chloroflexota bacterium]
MIQSVLLSRVNLWGARPDLMLLFVLTWAAVRDVDEGLVWGFVGGLIVDLLSGGPLGATALALLAVAFLAGQPWGRGIGSPVVRLLLLALASALVYHLILLTTLAWTGHTVGWGFSLLRVAVPSAVLNTLLAPFVQQPVAWLGQKVRRKGLTL